MADIAALKLDRKLDVQTIELASKPGDKVRLLGLAITEPEITGPLRTMLQEPDHRGPDR